MTQSTHDTPSSPVAPFNIGIAVVSPSGYAAPAAVARGVALLQAQGCRVRSFYRAEDRFQRFGASDEARAAQLMQAAEDPEIDVIMAVRGGYGLNRILPMLDIAQLAASGKRFVGYSDFTLLHLALLRAGASSIAGPMLASDLGQATADSRVLAGLWRALTQPTLVVRNYAGAPATASSQGDRQIDAGSAVVQCEGTFWGGNLSLVAQLAASPWMPAIEGGILFLEDTGEHPYKVERMLLQLQQQGILAAQKAVILGAFSGYSLSPQTDNGYDFRAMLDFLRGRSSTPIVTGLPFGHVRDIASLPVGAHAVLDARGGAGFTLTLSGYPVLV